MTDQDVGVPSTDLDAWRVGMIRALLQNGPQAYLDAYLSRPDLLGPRASSIAEPNWPDPPRPSATRDGAPVAPQSGVSQSLIDQVLAQGGDAHWNWPAHARSDAGTALAASRSGASQPDWPVPAPPDVSMEGGFQNWQKKLGARKSNGRIDPAAIEAFDDTVRGYARHVPSELAKVAVDAGIVEGARRAYRGVRPLVEALLKGSRAPSEVGQASSMPPTSASPPVASSMPRARITSGRLSPGMMPPPYRPRGVMGSGWPGGSWGMLPPPFL